MPLPPPRGPSSAAPDPERVDLDVGLDADERRRLEGAPLYGLAKLVGGFLLALLVVGGFTQWWEGRRQMHERESAIEAELGRIADDAERATPGTLPELWSEWATLESRVATLEGADRAAGALAATGERLARRGGHFLTAADVLSAPETARLAYHLDRFLEHDASGGLPAARRHALRSAVDAGVEAATAAATRRAGPGAAYDELVEAVFVLDRLATIVDSPLSARYREAAARVRGRAGRLKQQLNGESAPEGPTGTAGPGSAADREAFVRFARGKLIAQEGLSGVRLAGDEGRVLVVEGAADAESLVRLGLGNERLRSRLLSFGFRELVANGDDRTLRVDIASGSVRAGAAGS